METPAGSDVHAYYSLGRERDRLSIDARGVLEFERSCEIIQRRLPAAPGVVADVGGGPGRYALWLAGRGYAVEHRDLMPLHVEQLAAARGGSPEIRTQVADARNLDLADESVDAALLLGPIYHLRLRSERIEALREARRVVRPGGPIFVAAISRWAPRLDGELRTRMYEQFPAIREVIGEVESTGWMPSLFDGSFTAYTHRPGQLRREIRDAGLVITELVSVEGAAFLLGDLDERMADPRHWRVVMDSARATERVPELLGLGPHLLATCVSGPA